MNEKSADNQMLAVSLIDQFYDLQRIMTAKDQEREILYQLRITKEKLEIFGVNTENLMF